MQICDEHGIVFVVDEVQTGFGRTGKMWGIEHHGVEPDLMTVAKSIAGGLPLSAVLGKAEIMDAPPDSAIGGTYVGNPVAQAAAHCRARRLRGRRARRARRCDRRDDQGRGCSPGRSAGTRSATCGAWARCSRSSSSQDPQTKEPAPDLASAVIEEAFRNGLLLIKSGTDGNCIRVLTPLVITDAELDEALGVWEDALAAAIGA